MRAILTLTLALLATNGAVHENHVSADAGVKAGTAEAITALDGGEAAALRSDRLDIAAPPEQQAPSPATGLIIADAAPDAAELPAVAALWSPNPDALIAGPDRLALIPGDLRGTDDNSTDAAADAEQAARELPLDQLCTTLLNSAEDNNLPVPFFANLIWQESRLRDDVVSRAGAVGIAQFMPKVAAETGLDDPLDPRQALPASARLLRMLRAQFGNLGLVAAAYNAGAHRVSEWLQHHRALPRETRDYVVKITGRSAEQWRSSPLRPDSLTFTRQLPCRDLPAFADLEQAQQQQAQAEAAEKALATAAQAPAKQAQTKSAPEAKKPAKSAGDEVAERRHPHDQHRHHETRLASRETHEERRHAARAERAVARQKYGSAHREKGHSKAA